jgi:hypothetical protein
MSFLAPSNNIALTLHPSYPFSTAQYGECIYLADHLSDSSASANPVDIDPQSVTSLPDQHTSPPMVRRNLSLSSPLPDRISKDDYERVVQENTRLMLELEATKADAQKATKACRDLAAWTNWERDRLMRELAEVKRALLKMKEAHRALVSEQVDQLIAEESGRLPSYR